MVIASIANSESKSSVYFRLEDDRPILVGLKKISMVNPKDFRENYPLVLGMMEKDSGGQALTRKDWVLQEFQALFRDIDGFAPEDPSFQACMRRLKDCLEDSDVDTVVTRAFVPALDVFLTQLLSTTIPLHYPDDPFSQQSTLLRKLTYWLNHCHQGFLATPQDLALAEALAQLLPKIAAKFLSRSKIRSPAQHDKSLPSPSAEEAAVDVDLEAAEILEMTAGQVQSFVPLVPYLKPTVYPTPATPSPQTFSNLYDFYQRTIPRPMPKPIDRHPV